MFEFRITAESLADLKRQVGILAMDLGVSASTEEASTAAAGDAEGLRKALREIRGRDARRFYLDVAEASLRGEVLLGDRELLRRYNKTSGQALAGMQAGAYRVIDRVIHRRVILADPIRGGYEMSVDDARIVVDVFGKPGSLADTVPQP